MKTTKSNVRRSELEAARGGQGYEYCTEYLWVECPDSYDPAVITAEDILGDNMITVVDDEPEVGA